MNTNLNIAIIGAGPIGCYTGYLLAKYGHTVSIYEEHAQIGLPIQCTGLLTKELDQFSFAEDIKKYALINTFSQIEVNSPQQKLVLEQQEYLVDRSKFDRFFAGLAQKSGAKIYLQHSFLRKESTCKENNHKENNHKENNRFETEGTTKIIIKDLKRQEELILHPDVVIAADGPLSKTAQAYGFYHPQRKHYYGVQAIVNGNFSSKMYQTFFGQEICPDFFAWIVPESAARARVGLASKKETEKYFTLFLQKNNFQAEKIQAGTIPIYHPMQKLVQENCYLVGDAAGFVKATTLGGLIPGLEQAEILADCLHHQKNYEAEVKALRKKLKLHLKIHQLFNKFSDSDWDKLLKLLGQEKIQTVFKQHTRDNPFPLVLKSLWKEPRLLLFGKYLF